MHEGERGSRLNRAPGKNKLVLYKRNAARDAPAVIGDGGNHEGLAHDFMRPSPAWSAFREASYGHGTLEVVNATHALWKWHRNQAR